MIYFKYKQEEDLLLLMKYIKRAYTKKKKQIKMEREEPTQWSILGSCLPWSIHAESLVNYAFIDLDLDLEGKRRC